jgi:hypothetical protein
MEELSPLSQYYLRKLLNRSAELTQAEGKPDISDAPYRVMEILKSRPLEASARRELETLIRHYQNLETQLSHQNESLTEVKRRIFRILGLRINALIPSEIPTVVQEPARSLFRFVQQGALREGLNFENDVYGLIRQYSLIQRQQAYQVAWALTEQKVAFILTASELRYGLWICLRSPTYAVLSHQGISVLDRVVSLHSILNSVKESVFIHPAETKITDRFQNRI